MDTISDSMGLLKERDCRMTLTPEYHFISEDQALDPEQSKEGYHLYVCLMLYICCGMKNNVEDKFCMNKCFVKVLYENFKWQYLPTMFTKIYEKPTFISIW